MAARAILPAWKRVRQETTLTWDNRPCTGARPTESEIGVCGQDDAADQRRASGFVMGYVAVASASREAGGRTRLPWEKARGHGVVA